MKTRHILVTGALFACMVLAQQPPEDASDIPSFRVDTRLVEANISVFDKKGNPLPNLRRERFQIFDGGRLQPLVSFEDNEERVSCALLLDVTGSMDAFLPVLKNAVVRFVDELREREELAVYTFNTSLRLAQPFTADKRLIKQAVLRTRAGGGTALSDAVSRVSRDIEFRKGKKALVVFTDGADNSSMLGANSAARRAKLGGVPIYTVAEGDALRNSALLKTLEDLASESGGLAFRLDKHKIGDVFSSIVRDLGNTYLLSWKLPDDAGVAWRPVKVQLRDTSEVRIRTRQGYFPQ